MGIVYVLLPASLLLATLGVSAFVWAARQRQFDNVDVSGARLLFERDELAATGALTAQRTHTTPDANSGAPAGQATPAVAQGGSST